MHEAKQSRRLFIRFHTHKHNVHTCVFSWMRFFSKSKWVNTLTQTSARKNIILCIFLYFGLLQVSKSCVCMRACEWFPFFHKAKNPWLNCCFIQMLFITLSINCIWFTKAHLFCSCLRTVMWTECTIHLHICNSYTHELHIHTQC